MKIAIVNLTGGGLSGGYIKYLNQIVPLISHHPRVSNLLVVVPKGNKLNIEGNLLRGYSTNRGDKPLRQIKSYLREFNPDLIFIPTARHFSFGRVPVINMVRNMEPFQAPFGLNPLKVKATNILRAFDAIISTKFAARTIAVSKHVEKLLHSIPFLDKTKIASVYHGIDDRNLAPGVAPQIFGFNPSDPFVFTAGSIRPARGLEDLVLSIPHITSIYPGMQFLVAGAVDPHMDEFYCSLLKLADSLGVSSSLFWARSLTQHEMAWSFLNCKLFVMTSRAEACPNIALESMKYGSMTVSTSTSPMPEFYQCHAQYYTPYSHLSLAESAVEALKISDTDRALKSSAMKDYVSRYSWTSCVDSTINQFELAIASSLGFASCQ